MCFSSALAAIVGLSAINCEAARELGPDPVSHTDAIEIALSPKEAGLLIRCPRGTADCVSRARAICQERYRVVSPSGRSPKVQALLDLEIKTVGTDNPYELRIVCE